SGVHPAARRGDLRARRGRPAFRRPGVGAGDATRRWPAPLLPLRRRRPRARAARGADRVAGRLPGALPARRHHGPEADPEPALTRVRRRRTRVRILSLASLTRVRRRRERLGILPLAVRRGAAGSRVCGGGTADSLRAALILLLDNKDSFVFNLA